jgi:hypothetical protein
MNKPEIITSPSGDRLAVIPLDEYERLVNAANAATEDAADVAAYGVDFRGSLPYMVPIAGTQRRQRLRDTRAPATSEHSHAIPEKSRWF